MPHVNFLPWRERVRQRQQRLYALALAGVAVVVLGCAYVAATVIDKRLQNQHHRNQLLQQMIAQVDISIAQIKDIREQKQVLEQQIALIEQLQNSKNVAPRMLDELTRQVPTGINFISLNRSGSSVKIVGTSQANKHLSEFMRQLESSYLFANSELSSVALGADQPAFNSDFTLTFVLNHELTPRPDHSAAEGVVP